MTKMVLHEVGKPWPHAIRSQECMDVRAAPADEHLSITLVVGLISPSKADIRALSKEAVRFGILQSGALTFVVLMAKGIELDAPFAIGRYPPDAREAYLASARKAHEWSGETRGMLALTLVDIATNKIAAMRVISLSGQWWRKLADSLEAGVRLDGAAYQREIEETYRAYPAVKDMIGKCSIVESGGVI